jgi:hypothetical protein
MKKFIKELEDKGIMKRIVESGVFTENLTGHCVDVSGLEMILEREMSMDEDLEDIFLQEAHEIAMNKVFEYVHKQIEERQKVDALNDVDFDDLFAKATSKEEKIKKNEDLESKIEDAFMESVSKAFETVISDMLRKAVEDNK